jgi:ribonuclease P protein component
MNRRIAFLLGRGFGCAVERNRLKRRLRETYRRNKDWFPAGYDYILSPTPAGSGLPVARLEAETRKLTSRVPHHEPTA